MKHKVSLFTLWMMDASCHPNYPDETYISCGIWETREVLFDGKERMFKLVCVMPMHYTLKVGDDRVMHEFVLLQLCHQVKITPLRKINPKLTKRQKALQ